MKTKFKCWSQFFDYVSNFQIAHTYIGPTANIIIKAPAHLAVAKGVNALQENCIHVRDLYD